MLTPPPLIVPTPRAARQISAWRQDYEKLERPEATRNLIGAIECAWRRITANPGAGLPAPRPYPNITRSGRVWVQAGPYWIAYVTHPSPAIVAVVYDSADIPRRV